MSDIITFYGTDGSGKSAIAAELSKSYGTEKVSVIGGSSYKTWLTPSVATEVLGPYNRLNELSGSKEDTLKLYEDIGAACYGLALLLKSRGKNVIIDSDPFLKRVVWGTLLKSREASIAYVDGFNQRVTEIIGDTTGPDLIVGVNMDEHKVEAKDILARLATRSTNTEHDPTSLSEMVILNDHVNNVWSEIELAQNASSMHEAFNTRLNSSVIHHVYNPSVSDDQIDNSIKNIVDRLKSNINV